MFYGSFLNKNCRLTQSTGYFLYEIQFLIEYGINNLKDLLQYFFSCNKLYRNYIENIQKNILKHDTLLNLVGFFNQ